MAMACAAAVTAQFVSGKATRDALFLTSLHVTTLPTMLAATSFFSILLVVAYAKAARKIQPGRLVPASFVVSGVLFVCEWLFRSTAPTATAVLVYLHISGAGPLLASGFWLISSENFDPRTAKKLFGRITSAGTIGGLFGALLSERVAALFGVPAMLLVLGALQFLAAALVQRLAAIGGGADAAASIQAAAAPSRPARSGLRVMAEAPHLRTLATLVLLGTTGAALLDYLFKAEAVETFGPGDQLLRFFALYYAAISLVTFVLQMSSSRTMLERFGLGLTTSTPSLALLAGSIGGLIAPGFGAVLVARSGESIFRGSWFRAGYEVFFTPIPADEKRAAKSFIDVASDRLGDAVGGGLVRLAILFGPGTQSSAILSLAMATAIGAVFAASRLNRWYLRTLETSLVNRGAGIDLSDTQDASTAKVVRGLASGRPVDRHGLGRIANRDPEVRDILALRSRDRERIMEILARQEGIPAALVPHVIPLLAWDAVADHALFALRKIAEEHVGELVDALLDPNQDFAVRRRLARVFSVCVSKRAADGLMFALEDPRFDVRFQSARSLAAILDKNPRIHIDRDQIFDLVLREAAVGRPVWESRRLLDGFVSESPLDEFVRDRAGQSLAHVFTLLSLVLPREPLQIAFRSLHSEDKQLRGTALEYLEGVLPAPIRQALWPFLVRRRTAEPARPHDDVIAELLRSSQSITLTDIARSWEQRQIAGFSSN
jgi:hypothetical protein